jgi:hypothetical protein
VTQDFLHDPGRYALDEQERGAAVPEIVEPMAALDEAA